MQEDASAEREVGAVQPNVTVEGLAAIKEKSKQRSPKQIKSLVCYQAMKICALH